MVEIHIRRAEHSGTPSPWWVSGIAERTGQMINHPFDH
jgi:hypothetical protein